MTCPPLCAEDILYQDEDLLVVNKPAGIPVHGSRMLEGQPVTLLAMARKLTGNMVHAVHRLDRPVSGAILLTFGKESLAALSSSFEQHDVDKRYLAVARGWTDLQGTIDYPLLPPRDERRGGDEPREAVTRFERLATMELPIEVPPYRTARYSLLELVPETGRRHQLRRHMKHISHPLAGDTTYGKGEHNRLFRDHFKCSRLLLHSRSLSFRHPVTDAWVSVTAPLDGAFRTVADRFAYSETDTCPGD
jgi:tRNA pseudouridine65 synthase